MSARLWKRKIREKRTAPPKVSIIVPFYNAEKWIADCLESIISGTECPFEMLCVNDGSTDRSLKIVKTYQKRSGRIRIYNLKQNVGLYRARLCGIQRAEGDYIGFVDSDDLVSEGYFDRLYRAAEQEGADFAVGKIVNVSAASHAYLQTGCLLSREAGQGGKDFYERYWQQEGTNYHWHVVWNKLYKRARIGECLPVLESFQGHLVMLEDFIYSSVILSVMKKCAFAEEAVYYYKEHPESNINLRSFQAIQKNISDMTESFRRVEDFLASGGDRAVYLEHLIRWRERYGRYWKRNIEEAQLAGAEKAFCMAMLRDMVKAEPGQIQPEDDLMYREAEEVGQF